MLLAFQFIIIIINYFLNNINIILVRSTCKIFLLLSVIVQKQVLLDIQFIIIIIIIVHKFLLRTHSNTLAHLILFFLSHLILNCFYRRFTFTVSFTHVIIRWPLTDGLKENAMVRLDSFPRLTQKGKRKHQQVSQRKKARNLDHKAVLD